MWVLPLAAGLAVLVLGSLAGSHRPTGSSVAIWWPAAGVGVAAYAVAWRRQQRLPVLLALVLGLFSAELLAGYSLGMSAGFALAGATAPVLCIGLLSRWSPDLRLHDARDFARFCAAALLGALGTAAVAALPLHLGLHAEVGESVRAIVPSHLSAVLCIAPIALVAPRRAAAAGRVETALQVAAVVLVTLYVFAPWQDLPLSFLCIGFLIWGAARVAPFWLWLQVVLIATVGAVATTLGWGEYAAILTGYDLEPETMTTLLDVMLLGVPLAVWPLSLALAVHRSALAEVQESREMLDSILAGAAGTAILRVDLDGTVSSWNAGAEQVFGWSAEEVCGLRSLASLQVVPQAVPARAVDQFAALVEPLRRGLAWIDVDWRCERRDGDPITAAFRVTARRSATGEVVGWVALARDVTERRQADHALRVALERERLAVQRLEELDAVKSSFVQSVSHELRTPMTSVLGYTDMLREEKVGPLNERQRTMLASVSRNGRRLLTLIEDLLTLSRIEERAFTVTTEDLDLRVAVRRGSETVRPQAEAASVTLEVDLGDAEVPLAGDLDQLERLAINLLSNAVKFSEAGSVVRVAVEQHDGEAVLTVADQGMGVPQDELPRLFDRFFRATGARRAEVQGSGLGLAIVKEVVEHHDGSVEVASEEGVGTTFRVHLPLRRPTTPAQRRHLVSTRPS
jgi:PAS domain S-box-containing protein